MPVLTLSAQTPVEPPSQDQVDLLDRIQGVGPLKFGAKLESFDPTSLKTPKVEGPLSKQIVYQYLKGNGISWGTLHPTTILLQFHSGQLVAIRLWFDAPEGDLVAVSHALVEKYGFPQSGSIMPPQPGWVTPQQGMVMRRSLFAGGVPSRGWSGEKIEMDVVLPDNIRTGASLDELERTESGGVQFVDKELEKELSVKESDAVQQQIKNQDLEKIKADL